MTNDNWFWFLTGVIAGALLTNFLYFLAWAFKSEKSHDPR